MAKPFRSRADRRGDPTSTALVAAKPYGFQRRRPYLFAQVLGDVAVAGVVAGILSGVPSTAWALVRRDDLLASSRAAGTLLPGRRNPGLLAGVGVHAAISLFWTAVLDLPARGSRRGLGPLGGGIAGLGIAVLDLAFIGRRYPAIRALPRAPQYADHIAFGAVAAAVLQRRRLGQLGTSR